MINTIHLRRGKEESLLRRHPWVFSGAIESITEGVKPLTEGDIVDVVTKQGDFIARGHWQIGSIAVRVLTFEREDIDQAWWNRRIAEARTLRQTLGLIGNEATTCYRLIHGEGDLLPGLVVDVYERTAVVQCHSVGMYHSRQAIATAIREAYGNDIEAIYDKSSQTLPFKAELGAIDGYLWGRTAERDNIVLENGLKFKVNWEEGQKTGFFIDQRVNRDLVRQYAKGRKVLNTFCYTGGFSVAALAGGAKEVVSIDLSERAVKLAEENAIINFGSDAPHKAIACNAVEYLKDIDSDYDLIILDPPAFAKHHKVQRNKL
ncbi:MAG: class I SAM-dependent rRNA methyltransferase [Alistipes sp.]|nr:class I SAM-dependent rRNA methyltransferase [Alistipes sp.]